MMHVVVVSVDLQGEKKAMGCKLREQQGHAGRMAATPSSTLGTGAQIGVYKHAQLIWQTSRTLHGSFKCTDADGFGSIRYTTLHYSVGRGSLGRSC
jgi:hypothetical protein